MIALWHCVVCHFTLARIGINREDNSFAARAAMNDFNRRRGSAPLILLHDNENLP